MDDDEEFEEFCDIMADNCLYPNEPIVDIIDRMESNK